MGISPFSGGAATFTICIMVVFQGQASAVIPGFVPGTVSRFTAAALYYQASLGKAAHDTVKFAQQRFAEEGRTSGFAVDIGCGSGRDTLHMLRNGWQVLATDKEPMAFDYLSAQVDPSMRSRLSMLAEPMETIVLPTADLINASLSLPFCRPQFFDRLWRSVVRSLQPGGRFAGHFFGDKDTWAHEITQTHHTRCAVEKLLEGLEIEYFQEIEDDDPSIEGEKKHWQIYHVVARKPRI
jgi:SAM-dependent methyltransferase